MFTSDEFLQQEMSETEEFRVPVVSAVRPEQKAQVQSVLTHITDYLLLDKAMEKEKISDCRSAISAKHFFWNLLKARVICA